MRDYIVVIGIMTGNSLDGADLVLTKFSLKGEIQDIAAHSLKSPPELADALRFVRKEIVDKRGDMQRVVSALSASPSAHGDFDAIENRYTTFIAQGVKELVEKVRASGAFVGEVDLIGSHGQTCAHAPPSIAKSADKVYTVQIGNAQKLADLTGITVVADFRSDDVMNGGEGAPLAPVHHKHLAQQIAARGISSIAFCNGGNTGNVSVIARSQSDEVRVVGFDTGPFNHFPDALMRHERGLECDLDGKVGITGTINLTLLKLLFDKAVVTADGDNFLLKAPPRSSDPQWYRLLPELMGGASLDGAVLSFEDRMRTAQYFSAYISFYAFTHIGDDVEMPRNFALCGGGWKNPVVRRHFIDLVNGKFSDSPLLPQHTAILTALASRITNGGSEAASCHDSQHYGFDGTAMEARIIADAAFCRLSMKPFTFPETTGVMQPTVAGVIRFRGGDQANATETVREWISSFKSAHATRDNLAVFDNRWSRAAAHWRARSTP